MAFFTSVLNKYELFLNLLSLVLIRYLLVFFFLQVKFLLLLRFLRNVQTFKGSSLPFSPL